MLAPGARSGKLSFDMFQMESTWKSTAAPLGPQLVLLPMGPWGPRAEGSALDPGHTPRSCSDHLLCHLANDTSSMLQFPPLDEGRGNKFVRWV